MWVPSCAIWQCAAVGVHAVSCLSHFNNFAQKTVEKVFSNIFSLVSCCFQKLDTCAIKWFLDICFSQVSKFFILSSLSIINSDCKLQSLFECTFFLVADLISWVTSAISLILHVWVTSWDAATLLSCLGFVLWQHLGHVHTDWLPATPSKVLPSSCQCFSSPFHEKENSYWER